MTIQAIEIFESRTSRGTKERPTAERKFRVYDDADTKQITQDQAMNRPEIPDEYSAHPDFPWLRVVWPPEVQQVPGKRYAWDLVIKYEKLPIYVPDPNETDPNAPGYTEINTSNETIWVDAYRKLETMPSGDSINYPVQNTDISGLSIDSAGYPASYPIHVSQADITQIIEGMPRFTFYAKFENSRNDANYLGASPGKLLYTGNDSRRTGENLWSVTHHFAFDTNYHLRQAPRRLNDGKPEQGTRVYALITYQNVATHVFHIQPYPKTIDFGPLGLMIR